MNKIDLIQKLKQLEGLTTGERSALIELVNTKKKYGLVWEDKPEDVEELLRQNLPVLREVKDKYIEAKSMPFSEDLFSDNDLNKVTAIAPNHILIEGDNLNALTALSFTHKGKIDVIYIDPPYNTGNKDFKYNDSFVDKEDSYRHSKWLSFMNKRLRIAKELMSDKGAIFISIDGNEQAQLKLLCDDVFDQNNFISSVAVVNNFSGRSDDKYIATAHESILIYKMPNFHSKGVKAPEEYIDQYLLEDNLGRFRLQGLRKRGSGAKREDRPNMYYPFFYNPKTKHLTLEETIDSDYVRILPRLSDNTDGRWRWGIDTAKLRIDELQVSLVKKRNEYDINQKDYLTKNGDIKRIKPKSIWLNSEFSSDYATTEFKSIIQNNIFNYPKSSELIKFCLEQSTNTDSTILDFFAGSGTSLHATIQLNSLDGGNRQCILVTNNENNICEEVTYERNKRIIQGYTNAKGIVVAGLTNNNLRYYKSEFVPSTKNEANRRLLTNASTELLCIRENCFTDVTKTTSFKNKECSIFKNDVGKYMLVIYHSRNFPTVCEQVILWTTENFTLPLAEKIRLYCFSPEKDSLAEDFADVADYVEAVPLPDAIYNAFRATFKTLKLDRKHIELNPTEAEMPTTLFDDETADA